MQMRPNKNEGVTGVAEQQRADYGREDIPELGARVAQVEKGSPAWEAGLEPGMIVRTVNGTLLDDIITWRWETADDEVQLEVEVPGEEGVFSATLERQLGEPWGLNFTDVLFDGVRTCKNACVFCFMAMLPKGLRDSLYLRDDDYRLSFLQGNFVTLTNVDDKDLQRILDLRLEPMNVSLHAVSPEARTKMMGKNQARGLEVLEALCEAGIEVHAQIVLCPGLNDGDELIRTLDFVEAHPTITSLAIVPMGYTKHSPFTKSYSDDPASARAVIAQVEPYQARSRETTGATRFQLSDEFYVAANVAVPPAQDYDGYPQYYDGIGMLRSFIDDTGAVMETMADQLVAVGHALEERDEELLVVCGKAAEKVYQEYLAQTPWAQRSAAFAIPNDYFGGDVNVTGLIVAQDLLKYLPQDLHHKVVVLPQLMLNFNDNTLDGMGAQEVLDELSCRGADVLFLTTLPQELLEGLFNHLVRDRS